MGFDEPAADARVYVVTGEVLAKTRSRGADRAFLKALATDPGHVAAACALARIRAEEGAVVEAERILTTLPGASAAVWLVLAEIKLKARRYAQALEWATRARGVPACEPLALMLVDKIQAALKGGAGTQTEPEALPDEDVDEYEEEANAHEEEDEASEATTVPEGALEDEEFVTAEAWRRDAQATDA